MSESGYLYEVIVILAAAVILVLLFQRLQLGSVLGYLVAGTVIGPTGLGLVGDLERTRALADFMKARALGLRRFPLPSPDQPPPRR